MRYVVSQWKEQQDDGEHPGRGKMGFKCAAQTRERQYRERRAHKNIRWIQWLLRQILAAETPEARPHINNSPHSHPCEPARMGADKIHRLAELVIHVGDLSHLHV